MLKDSILLAQQQVPIGLPPVTSIFGNYAGSKDFPDATSLSIWSNWQAGTTNSIETTDVYDGTTALRINSTNATAEVYENTIFAGATTGQTINLRGYVKIKVTATTTDSNGEKMQIMLYESNGSPVEVYTVLDETNTTDWQYFEISRTVTSGGQGDIYILLMAGNGQMVVDALEAWID